MSQRSIVLWLSVAVTATLVSCGSRTGLSVLAAGSDGSVSLPEANGPIDAAGWDADASESDAGLDVGSEASSCGLDASGCVVTLVQFGSDGNGGCKFFVSWMCNEGPFRTGGYCAPTNDGTLGGTFEGSCGIGSNGPVLCTFMGATTTCFCGDRGAAVAFGEAQCGIQ